MSEKLGVALADALFDLIRREVRYFDLPDTAPYVAADHGPAFGQYRAALALIMSEPYAKPPGITPPAVIVTDMACTAVFAYYCARQCSAKAAPAFSAAIIPVRACRGMAAFPFDMPAAHFPETRDLGRGGSAVHAWTGVLLEHFEHLRSTSQLPLPRTLGAVTPVRLPGLVIEGLPLVSPFYAAMPFLRKGGWVVAPLAATAPLQPGQFLQLAATLFGRVRLVGALAVCRDFHGWRASWTPEFLDAAARGALGGVDLPLAEPRAVWQLLASAAAADHAAPVCRPPPSATTACAAALRCEREKQLRLLKRT